MCAVAVPCSPPLTSDFNTGLFSELVEIHVLSFVSIHFCLITDLAIARIDAPAAPALCCFFSELNSVRSLIATLVLHVWPASHVQI